MIVIYLSCIPGIFSLILTVYTSTFTEINLLEVNTLIYFLPIISMIFTLLLIKRRADYNDIPGFGRISGLILLFIVIFVTAFILHKLRILVIFGTPFFILLAGGILLYILFRFSWKRIKTGKK